jgi:hypothetical protein
MANVTGFQVFDLEFLIGGDLQVGTKKAVEITIEVQFEAGTTDV